MIKNNVCFDEGNFVFEDTCEVKKNCFFSNNYVSFLKLVIEFNSLYKQFRKDLDKGMSHKDLFIKHKEFVLLYYNYRNSLIFYKDRYSVTTHIGDGNSSVFSPMETFTIGYGNFYGDYVSLVIKLGGKTSVDYEKSAFYKRNKKTSIDKDVWDRMSSTTHIHRKYTKKMYRENTSKKYIKK